MWPGLVSTWFPLVWILFETDVFLWVGYELLEVMSEICIAYQSISINIHTKLSHLINNYAPLRHSETRLPDVVIQITASIHFISRFLMVHTLLNFSKKENRNTTINGHLDMCKKKRFPSYSSNLWNSDMKVILKIVHHSREPCLYVHVTLSSNPVCNRYKTE